MRGWRNAAFAVLSATARVLDLASRASLYVAAGALRRQDLTEAITRAWDEFSRGDAAILSGLMSWEKVWYERVLKPADHILLVGCGTGRDLIALLELGYRVPSSATSRPISNPADECSSATSRRRAMLPSDPAHAPRGAADAIGLAAGARRRPRPSQRRPTLGAV
jgi:hypothetical protein